MQTPRSDVDEVLQATSVWLARQLVARYEKNYDHTFALRLCAGVMNEVTGRHNDISIAFCSEHIELVMNEIGELARRTDEREAVSQIVDMIAQAQIRDGNQKTIANPSMWADHARMHGVYIEPRDRTKRDLQDVMRSPVLLAGSDEPKNVHHEARVAEPCLPTVSIVHPEMLNPSVHNPVFARTPYKKSGCFIATACYGDYEAPEVIALRRFRDECLMTTKVGKSAVTLYYVLSPAIARVLSRHRAAANAVRDYILAPIVRRVGRIGR